MTGVYMSSATVGSHVPAVCAVQARGPEEDAKPRPALPTLDGRQVMRDRAASGARYAPPFYTENP